MGYCPEGELRTNDCAGRSIVLSSLTSQSRVQKPLTISNLHHGEPSERVREPSPFPNLFYATLASFRLASQKDQICASNAEGAVFLTALNLEGCCNLWLTSPVELEIGQDWAANCWSR